jgi:L,D-peptidoglycan transpeptidase YkuD (ErfK/YbiS/YcfS/YnhG family)
MRRIALATVLTAAVVLPLHEAHAKYCPRVLYRATRLIMVSVPTMQSTVAHVRTFERLSPAAVWEPRSMAEPAVVGMRGIAWGDIYASLAKNDEPVKREGDHRTPAGVYRINATFGAEDTKLPGHITLMRRSSSASRIRTRASTAGSCRRASPARRRAARTWPRIRSTGAVS